MKKRALSIFLVLAISITLVSSVFAAMPRWTNTQDCDVTLTFNGSTAGCTVDVTGKTGTSKIVGTVELQVKNSSGRYVRSAIWPTKTVNGTDFTFSEYAYNRTAGDYRLIVNATVYNSKGVGEDVYGEATRTCNG